jgi:hypothetical protein
VNSAIYAESSAAYSSRFTGGGTACVIADLMCVGGLDFAADSSNTFASRSGQEDGRHAGLIRTYSGKLPKELLAAASSLLARAGEKLIKAGNPSSYVSNWAAKNPEYEAGIVSYWLKEARVLLRKRRFSFDLWKGSYEREH